jgi:hypothetical protein
VSTDTHRVRGELVTHLRSVARASAIVVELPDLLRVLRARMTGARDFNIQRSYAQAFVRDTLGKHSPIYQAVQAVPVRKVTPKVRKHPLTPAEVLAVAAGFDTLRADADRGLDGAARRPADRGPRVGRDRDGAHRA